MSFPFFIARRYLFSKKSTNVINIISRISMGGIAVGTFALIVVLSAFNGLESLVESLYNSFDADLRVTVAKGKTFDRNSIPATDIQRIEGVEHFTWVIEETVILKFRDQQLPATMKAVEQDFIDMSGLDSMMIDGELVLTYGNQNYAVMGSVIADRLRVVLNNTYDPMAVYVARRGVKTSINTAEALRKSYLNPAGVFGINQDFDSKYVLVPYAFGRDLLEYGDEVTAFEIGLDSTAYDRDIKAKLQTLLGDQFVVETRYEQNKLIYQTNQTEKWITFLILSFILVIATFNLVGSLSMLIIDKRKDISILKSMGASKPMIQRIFLFEGLLISFIGGAAGLFFGWLLCWLHITLGLVPLEGSIVDYYPVEINAINFVYVGATVGVIGLIAAWFPSRYVTNRYFD